MPTTDGLRLDDQLCFALYAATNAITRSYRPRLEALGLTYPQYLVMLVLWQDGPSPSGHIARRLRLGSNAIPPLVDQLARAGLVRRSADPADGRRTIVEPTEEGRRAESAAALAQAQVACDTGLDPERFDALRRTLMELTEALAERPESADPVS